MRREGSATVLPHCRRALLINEQWSLKSCNTYWLTYTHPCFVLASVAGGCVFICILYWCTCVCNIFFLCGALCCSVMVCIVLRYVSVFFLGVFGVVFCVFCGVLGCTEVCRGALWSVVMGYRGLLCVSKRFSDLCCVLWCVFPCCDVLQRFVMCL